MRAHPDIGLMHDFKVTSLQQIAAKLRVSGCVQGCKLNRLGARFSNNLLVLLSSCKPAIQLLLTNC